MKLLLKRTYFSNAYTIGKLYIDGVYFCDTIEDVIRDLPVKCPNTPQFIDCKCKEKVYKETAIPCGIYKVVLYMSPSKKRLLPTLLDVPHFLGILIHRGNTAKDSYGCIIVGENKVKGQVINSTIHEEKLVEILKGAKDDIIIEIT